MTPRAGRKRISAKCGSAVSAAAGASARWPQAGPVSPGPASRKLGAGLAYASKAAYHLLSQPVAAGIVRVWEEGGKLEWLLLCEQPVESFAQARERAWYYATRWLIEDFHKALKSGLGAERLQLHTGHRLFAAVAVLSVVALALVDLREQSRQCPDAPAEAAGLPPPYLRLLRHQQPRALHTVRDVFYALAGLGGHLGRKSDGPPGWQTLWRGLLRLHDVVEGMQLVHLLREERFRLTSSRVGFLRCNWSTSYGRNPKKSAELRPALFYQRFG